MVIYMCGQGFELETMLKQIQVAVSCPIHRNPESRIQEMVACGIRNIAQRILNPINKSNPESKFSLAKNLESSAWNAESAEWNLEWGQSQSLRPILTSGTPIFKFSNLTAHAVSGHPLLEF